MANAIDRAIRELESEREQIDQALDALRSVQARRNGSGEVDGYSRPSGSSILHEEMTTREAVLTILRRSTNTPLTTREIAERGTEWGKELNINSVRWDLNHGTEDGVYEKLPPEEGSRAKRYRLTE